MRYLGFLAALLLLASCATAQTAALADDFAVQDVGNGIYVHHGMHLDIDEGYHGDICNASFIVGSKGVAVIDTGGSIKIGQQLRQVIRKVTPLPILYVINTHVHPDHIYGNAAFSADKPAFIGHEKLATVMELRREQYAKLNAKLLVDDAKGSELIKPTMVVKIGTTQDLDLGNRTLTLTAHPIAHTTTDVSVIDIKTDGKISTLFAGDLLFIERTPVLEGDIKGVIAELEKFKSLPINQVVPGHGTVTKDWQQAINNQQRYLNVLLTDIRANIKAGKSMNETMDTAAASEKDKWVLFDIANRRNVNIIYPALEWE
jgi:quinoprotein relay system zinc metallohydrolase 2